MEFSDEEKKTSFKRTGFEEHQSSFCLSFITKKEFKVRSKREHSPGLHTVLHYPQRVKPCYQPYTLKPKRTKIRSKYEFSKGLHTVLHYPQEIVLKHFIHVKKKQNNCVINYKIIITLTHRTGTTTTTTTSHLKCSATADSPVFLKNASACSQGDDAGAGNLVIGG